MDIHLPLVHQKFTTMPIRPRDCVADALGRLIVVDIAPASAAAIVAIADQLMRERALAEALIERWPDSDSAPPRVSRRGDEWFVGPPWSERHGPYPDRRSAILASIAPRTPVGR